MRLAVVLASATLVAACASIVTLDEADIDDDGTTTRSSSGGSTSGSDAGESSSSSGAASSSGASSGAPADAGEDAPPAPNGGACRGKEKTCDVPAQTCAEDGLCRDECKSLGTPCTFDKGQCCFRSFCPFGFPNAVECTACIPDGQEAAKTGGLFPLERSCCSGNVDALSGKCKK